MAEFFYILTSISLPIVILIAIGFVFQKIFKTNSRGFTRLLLYFLTPIMIFVKMYKIEITWDFVAAVVPYIVIFNVIMILIGMILARAMRQKKSKEKAMVNSLVLYNSGNYGIPLIELAFGGNPITMMSQLFVVIGPPPPQKHFLRYNWRIQCKLRQRIAAPGVEKYFQNAGALHDWAHRDRQCGAHHDPSTGHDTA